MPSSPPNAHTSASTPEQVGRLHGGEYARRFEQHQHPGRIDRLIRHIAIPPGAVIGDFGCGNGLFMEHVADLKERIGRYYGIDLSQDLLAFARQRRERLNFPRASFHLQSVQAFAAEHAGELDLALALDFSEHVPDAPWLEILQAIRAALKPDGRLYLHTPNADFLLERMKARNFILKQFPEHIAVRNAAQMTSILTEAGFGTIDVRYLPHYNVLRHLHPLSRLPGVGGWFRARLFMTAQPAEIGSNRSRTSARVDA